MVQGWREDTFKLAEKLLSRKNLNVLVSASEFTSHFRYDNNHTTCVLVRGCEVYVGWAKRNPTDTYRGQVGEAIALGRALDELEIEYA